MIKRLPVRLVFDNNYFNDKYQGIPIGGYNKLINICRTKLTVKMLFSFCGPSILRLAMILME